MTASTDGPDADSLTLLAPAKVNLFLEVTARRADGYHDIDTLMVAVNLFDQVDLVIAPKLTLTCTDASLPTGPANLAVKAAEALRAASGCKLGAKIHLTKRIPAEAGLAGGSSDAAATLLGLNRLWNLGISTVRLSAIAAEVGSDVAFFLHPPAARCTGRGDVVQPIALAKPLHLVLVCPAEGLSTAQVYSGVTVPSHPRDGATMAAAVRAGDAAAVGRELFNRLQEPAEELCPRVRQIQAVLAQSGTLGSQMSGSGSSLFAVCGSASEAEQLARRLRAELTQTPTPRIFVASTC